MDARQSRLIAWNRFWLVVSVFWLVTTTLIGLWGYAGWLVAQGREGAISVDWQDAEVLISSNSDGPYLITHLTVDQPGRAFDVTAALARPVAVVESGRTVIPASDVARLEWRNRMGQAVARPSVGSRLRALWVRGRWSRVD